MKIIFVAVAIIVGLFILGKLFLPMVKHLIVVIIGSLIGGVLFFLFGIPVQTVGIIGIVIAVGYMIFGKIKLD